MRKNYRELFCYGFIGVLYVFAVIKATLLPMHVPVEAWQMLLFAFAAILFYFLVTTRPGSIVFFSAVALTAGYVAYTVIRDGTGSLQETFAPVIQLVQVIIKVGTGYHDETVTDASLMWAVGIFAWIVALPVYSFLVHRFRFYWLIIPGLAFFMTVWGIIRHVDKLSFYIFIIIAILCFIRHKYIRHAKTTGETNDPSVQTNLLIYFIPVAVVVILFTTSLRVNPMPIQWPWLDEKINTWYWDLHLRFSVDRYDKFTLAGTGFGDPSRLGGPVRPDYTPIMVVHAPTRVYLRGAVYDQYTGVGWEASEKSTTDLLNERTSGHQELHYGWKAASAASGIWSAEEYSQYLEGIGEFLRQPQNSLTPEQYLAFIRPQQIPQLLNRLHPEAKLKVRHLNVRTKTLFTPLKIFEPITGLAGFALNENYEGVYEADRRLPGESEYSFNYLQPAYGMDVMDQYFNTSEPGIYRRFNEYNRAFIEKLDETDILNAKSLKNELEVSLNVYNLLERHRNEVYELYTTVPESVPQRLKDLANEIAIAYGGGGNKTYTIVKSLETYLRQNYTYTLNPQVPPEGQDFVDYFLFDGREGYCSYFASALCIMTRSLGIPARYVEGFVMPEKPDENGFYHVTNQYAHAWVEVYLEGIGWLTFEPTAPYADAQNYFVSLSDATGEGWYDYDMPDEFDPSRYMQEGASVEIDLPGYDDKEVTSSTVLIWAVGIVLAVFFMNLMAVMVRRFILQIISPKKSVRFLYQYHVRLLRQAGCELWLGETPKDFAMRVDDRYQFINMRMTEMVEVFYSVRFGDHMLDKKRMKQLLAFTREVKAKSGRNMVFIKRLLLRGLLFRG